MGSNAANSATRTEQACRVMKSFRGGKFDVCVATIWPVAGLMADITIINFDIPRIRKCTFIAGPHGTHGGQGKGVTL
jgi:hypothetical protein